MQDQIDGVPCRIRLDIRAVPDVTGETEAAIVQQCLFCDSAQRDHTARQNNADADAALQTQAL